MRACTALRAAAVLGAPLWATLAAAAADGPTMKTSTFNYIPDNFNYFEDSDVVIFHDYVEGLIYRSTDAGASWAMVADIPAQVAARLIMHEFDAKRAYVLTEGTNHFRTEDQGQTWTRFDSKIEVSMFQFEALSFHAKDPDRIIFNGMDYDLLSFSEVAMYTTDGFRSDAMLLRTNTDGCRWAVATDTFTTGSPDLDRDRILCTARDPFSPRKQDHRLVISDTYFKSVDGAIQEFEPDLDTNRPVQGVVSVAPVKRYLLVATTSLNTDEMALYVSDDTRVWHRAVFPSDHHINQEAYTVLESTAYSIQIDVMNTRPSDPMGVLLTSNSNGTFFTENVAYTNRNQRGHVDFEKISGIQGVFLVNRVTNGEAVDRARDAKKIVTEITFDDGRTFDPVMLDGDDGDDGKVRLHLHSVTDLSNAGRVFSSPAPGLVMAVGNTGESLGEYATGNLYVSDDAGVTWRLALLGPHKYEFGDQGSVLVAVYDHDDVDQIMYSLDHGQTWAPAKLPDGLKMRPYILTTTQDSTSLKFVLIGEQDDKWVIVAIDFAGLHEATCEEGDMEDWWARVDDKGEPTCLMGHTQKYHRRKKTAACFLKKDFLDPVAVTTDCPCSDADFECDYNFRRSADGKTCEPAGPVLVPEGACTQADKDKTFQGSSGWRLIPGNTCQRAAGPQKDDLVERPCTDAGSGAPGTPGTPTGKVLNTVYDVDVKGYTSFELHYLERGDTSADATDNEAIIMRPVNRAEGEGGPIFVTGDHGKTWTRPSVFDKVSVWAIVPHAYFKEAVFFPTAERRVLYTIDHGRHFHEFEAPYPPDTQHSRLPLVFHPDHKDWLIWIGKKCEGTGECYTEASLSRDRGDNWQTLLRYVDRCEFIGSSAYLFRHGDEVVCTARAHEEGDSDSDSTSNPLQLVTSSDWFATKTVHAESVRGFATMAEFLVVAADDAATGSLRALASLDGETYAEAHFPANVQVGAQHEYTVLDSSTHAVNLFVATERTKDKRYGALMKSNSNGTSYVLSIAGVNCNNAFYVDFEKMLGLEGVAVVNVVANRDDAKATAKKLQTKISHNDGAEWAFLPPPARDVDGKAYKCRARKGASEGGDERCALHIHGYTEREDRQKTYSSAGAVGLMFGVGNVGDSLGRIEDADTFMTSDAGLTWRQIRKGAWSWEFGDQGSIVAMVPRHAKTRTLSYSTDEGATWTEHQFSDADVDVLDFTTVRSGASRNFLVWCRTTDGRLQTVNIDFGGLTERACVHDDRDAGASDYYLWSPSHPMLPDSQCLFGHVSQYLRKKTDRACYNGYKLQHLYNTQNCTCSRRDYECDYNFEQDNHGQCSLVPGLEPLSKSQWCADHPDAIDYYPPTGFRRLPLTTCEGGVEFDKQTAPQPCSNREDDFERKHRGLGFWGVLGVVVASLVLTALLLPVLAYVYKGLAEGGGSIRLGEDVPTLREDARDFYPKLYQAVHPHARHALLGALAVAVALGQALWGAGSSLAGYFQDRLGRGGGVPNLATYRSLARENHDAAYTEEDSMLGDDSEED